jgi:glycosyltransferase involved in cell wall biosynthesis
MKIAIVARIGDVLPTPTTHTWAPGIVIANEAQTLTKMGMDVRVYCAKGSKVSGQIIDFDMLPSAEAYKDLDPPQKRIRDEFYNNVYQLKVIEHLRTNPVDIIHLHTYRDYPLYRAANLNMPIVVTIHNDFFHSFNKMTEIIKPDINVIDMIAIGNTPRVPDGIRPPIAILPNILDLQRFKFISNPKDRVVHGGRLIWNKGPDLAIEAARLAGVEIGIYGGAFGDKEWEENLKELFQKSPHVTFHGFLQHDQVDDLFDAKAFLLPIRQPEGFPSVVIESMASGTPVIAYKMGGTEDLIEDGINGFLVEPGDMEGLVAAIKQIDKIDRKKCRDYVFNRFGEEVLGKKLVGIFQEIISKYQK